MTLIAKRTAYKHFRFASRLEGRWAYFLDELGVPWKYEPEPYDLGGGLTYIPDLDLSWLWHEVKGEIRDDQTGNKIIEKCTRLAVLSGKPVMLTFHDPMDMRCALFGIKGGMYTNAHYQHCPMCGHLAVFARVDGVARSLCPNKQGHSTTALPIEEQRRLSRLIFEAATKARQRKFGFE